MSVCFTCEFPASGVGGGDANIGCRRLFSTWIWNSSIAVPFLTSAGGKVADVQTFIFLCSVKSVSHTDHVMLIFLFFWFCSVLFVRMQSSHCSRAPRWFKEMWSGTHTRTHTHKNEPVCLYVGVHGAGAAALISWRVDLRPPCERSPAKMNTPPAWCFSSVLNSNHLKTRSIWLYRSAGTSASRRLHEAQRSHIIPFT